MPGYLSDEPNLESGETSGSHGGRKSFPLNLPIEEYREAYSTTSGSRQPIHMSHGLELEEQDIPLSDGTTNRIQLIRPGKEHFFHMPHLRHRKRPIIVVYHGGAFVAGRSDDLVDRCLPFAKEGAIVVLPNYRLAPEYPFPTGFKDCHESFLWVRDHASQLGGDPSKLIVAGASAGGNLAAAVALEEARLGRRSIQWQILEYPIISQYDAGKSATSTIEGNDDPVTSMQEFVWSTGKFCSDRAPEAISDAELNDPRAWPILAPDSVIKNLPPAYITTAEADPLHDGVVDYATRLMDNGVEVVLKDYIGSPHSAPVLDTLPASDSYRKDLFNAFRTRYKH